MDCKTLVRLAHSFGSERKLLETIMTLCRKVPYDITAFIIEFRGIDITDVASRIFQYVVMDIKLEGEYEQYIFDFRVSSHIFHAVFGHLNNQIVNWPRIFTDNEYYIDDDVASAMDEKTVRAAVSAYFNRPYDPMFNADDDCVTWSMLNIISRSGFEFTNDIIDDRSDRIERLLDMAGWIEERGDPALDSLLDVAAGYDGFDMFDLD